MLEFRITFSVPMAPGTQVYPEVLTDALGPLTQTVAEELTRLLPVDPNGIIVSYQVLQHPDPRR